MALSVPCLMVRAFRFDLFCLLLYAHTSLAAPGGGGNVPVLPVSTHPWQCISILEQYCPPPEVSCLCVLQSQMAVQGGGLMTGNPSSATQPSVLCCHLRNASQLWTEIECAVNGTAVANSGGPFALHIRNSSLEGLAQSLDVLSAQPMLSSLTVTHSVVPLDDMTHGPLTTMASSVACLNLSSNGMGDLPAGALMGLSSLRALDLSHNNVTHLPDLPPRRVAPDGQEPLWVDISGNERLRCSGIKEAMSWNSSATVDVLSPPTVLSNASSSLPRDAIGLVVGASSFPPPAHKGEAQPPVLFHNKEHTYCITLMKDLWFHWMEKIPLDKIEHIIKLECPSGQGYTCVCTIQRFEQSDFSVAVDCSNRGLMELPNKLPKHTKSLNVTKNKITSLEPLGKNVYYNNIRDFYADNNEITSIEVLEGSDFLNNFQHLALSGNKLKNLPMYILNQMFNRDSKFIRYLKLGKNEYHCDCNTYNGLKDWVLHNKKQITDHEDMLCDAEVYNIRIIDLQVDEVCLQKDWKDYLPFVVLVEVLLLIGLVTKVSYDYWIFKTKGYLPWPASRTPKLPCCDWAFDA